MGENYVMKKVKILFISVGLIALVAAATLFSACANDGTLSAPIDLKIENEILYFSEVKGAKEYMISVDGKEFTSNKNSCDLFDLFTEYKSYEIKVQALGDLRQSFDSDWSETINYDVGDCPVKYGFKPIENESEYAVYALSSTGKQGKLIIPYTAPDGKPVTKIKSEGFSSCTGLTGVYMTDAITEISDNAFQGCGKIKRVILSPNVDVIKSSAFWACSSLEKIDLSKISEIGDSAFYDCSALTDVTLTTKLKKIEGGAFFKSGLKRIKIPKTVESIGTGVFSRCCDLEEITIDKENAFYRSDGNTIIRNTDNALIAGIKNSIIPSGVSSIKYWAFNEASPINIIVPGSVKKIEQYAFVNCKKLKGVELSEGVERLEGFAFNDCINLEKVEIPSSVNYIGAGIFEGCVNLTSVTVASNNSVYLSEGNTVIRKADDALVAGLKNGVIPSYVKIIEKRAFNNVGLKENIIIPYGVEKICENAFGYCRFEKIILPKTLKIIENRAFYICSNLTEIYLNDGLEEIGAFAFSECGKVKYLAIPESVKKIERQLFSDDNPIEHFTVFLSVTLPECVETISHAAFSSSSTLYTSSREPYPQKWSSVSGVTITGCELSYDDGAPYVDSFTYVRRSDETAGKKATVFISILYDDGIVAPYRKGYNFKGWAIEKDGQPVYGEPRVKNNLLLTFDAGEIEEVPDGATLYAVWEKAR